MILVETEVDDSARRSRALLVSHVATGLPRGLEPGEVVVVRSGEEHWTASVVDIGFTLEDTIYRFSLGGRISADRAADLVDDPGADRGVDGPEGASRSSIEVTDVLALLGSLREAGGVRMRVPARRAVGGLLVDLG